MALLLELEDRVDSQFFAMCVSVGLRPLDLPWVPLLLEVLVALGSAELEGFAVVSDEGDAMARVDVGGTEVTLLYP
eukprot:CAMPEP_0204916598 /NCGR_PEP_ID=MMETSP1397-20131031/14367_1 /ASSEMBLY_ACC=CAM_ASM_000891 /TAXON_ID=49980 /ORGANISM="Climacostomum Climacostomum virens, Strain Stock W-24" /LENGTH=75 /DNA_ID=CAMNT_0052089149 /DNA_START=270 /DNA_END=494 /DNA_ORIENTATION=+